MELEQFGSGSDVWVRERERERESMKEKINIKENIKNQLAQGVGGNSASINTQKESFFVWSVSGVCKEEKTSSGNKKKKNQHHK